MFNLNDLSSIKISLASPDQIAEWGRGEVTKSETINYRSQKPEPDGLFCEKIFGPVKDYECHCGHMRKSSSAGKICDKCGVEVTVKAVRRERMGYIKLVSPCTHIWFVKGSPSKMALTLGVSPKQLEEVVYYVSSIVVNPGESKILKERDILDEKSAREVFAKVIEEEILPDKNKVNEGDKDYVIAQDYVLKLRKPSYPFDFLTTAKFVSKHMNCDVGKGATAILSLLKKIDLDEEIKIVNEELKNSSSDKNPKRVKAMKRLDVLKSFKGSGIKPECMIISTLPVIPPDLRPMMQLDGGRYAASDINELYRHVINRNNRLKREIEVHSPQVILTNERRMLQEAVDALIDNGRRNKPTMSSTNTVLKSLSSSLQGKQGRFRQNLLGKRVDYSGRSVIAVGPELNMDECGIPREMAIMLFKPFIAHYLTNNENLDVATTQKAEDLIAKNDPCVFDAIEEIVKEHPVLLNRAPTLHRLGIQAFKPKLIEGKAIRLHPLVCPGFNADFDGDQMAVHVPLSKKAQAEAMNLMLASRNILKPSDGKPICVPSQDMIFGNYYLTLEDDIDLMESYVTYYKKRNDEEMVEKFKEYEKYEGKVFANPETAIRAYESGKLSLRTRIYVPAKSLNKEDFTNEQKGKFLLTTVGKLIFNNIFPSDFPYINFPFKTESKKAFEQNLEATLDSFFVSMNEAREKVIASGNKKESDDFNPFVEYVKIVPLRKPIEKSSIEAMMSVIFRKYGALKTASIMDGFKNQGFKYCTKSGLTISLGDIEPFEGRDKLYEEASKKVQEINSDAELGFFTNEQRHDAVVNVWQDVKNGAIAEMLKEKMAKEPRNPMFMMMESGARGSKDNYTQLIGMKGCMLDSAGRSIEIPVTDCYADGLTVSEYFTSTHGTRKNGADTALKTANSGYFTRRLVDLAHAMVITEEDCHCDHGEVVEKIIDDQGNEVADLYSRIVGRYSMHDIISPLTGELLCAENTFIDEKIAKSIIDSGITSVEIRSVLTCESVDGICIHCYGRNLATGQLSEIGDTVGIMAAQSIGEPGTQLTLKNFHTGGVAGQKDITTGLPRVIELIEVNKLKAKDSSLISRINGVVTSIKEDGLRHVFKVKNNIEEKEFTSYPNAIPNVVEGQEIKAGYPLTKGHINPQALLECADLATTQNYIIKEVKAVYKDNGIEIADKHLEIIVKLMTNKIYVINPGSTDLLPGQRVNSYVFTKKNLEAFKEGKNPAVGKPLIIGVKTSALDTESFLSAASFQETTRVLTNAAIKGKIDYLTGLKENVIVGKLIPAGTGLKLNKKSETLKLAESDKE